MITDKEIGSEFESSSNNEFISKSSLINYINGDFLAFRSGRDAFRFLSNSLSKKRILFPSLSCDSMLQPFIDCGFEIVFYHLNDNFIADIDEISKKIKLCDTFLYHNYFGVKSISDDVLTKLKSNYSEVSFIYDATHDFHTFDCRAWDFKVISIRKWFSIPEGGILIPADISVYRSQYNSLNHDSDYLHYRKSASAMKSDYLSFGNIQKDTFLGVYKVANEKLGLDKRTYCMSEFSLDILNRIDFEAILAKRTVNYKKLLGLFANDDILKKYLMVNSYDSMLYLPLFVSNRDYLQFELAKKGIYCPVLWIHRITSVEYSKSLINVENHNLCLPCDHRYDESDMERIYSVFKFIIGELK